MSTVQIVGLTPATSIDGSELVPLQEVGGGPGSTESSPFGAIISPGYIDGLRLVWVSATTLAVGNGTAFILGLGRAFRAPTSIAKTGLSLTASTWYHVYLYSNSGTPAVEIVTTAPVHYWGTASNKTGDTSRRYLGSILTDGSGNIYNFLQVGQRILYQSNTGSAPFRVLSAGAATSSTTVTFAGAIPLTSQLAIARMTNAGSGAQAYVANSNMSSVSSTNYLLTQKQNNDGFYEILTDSSQNANYINSASGGSQTIDVLGYVFDR